MPATALRTVASPRPTAAAATTAAAIRQIADFMTGASFEATHPTAADIEALRYVVPARA